MATQYIFRREWYDAYVGQNPNNTIPDAQRHVDPPGGWTASLNVDWLLDGMHAGDKFVLLGNIYDLSRQCVNAGRQRCMVGAEALILSSGGYTVRLPDANEPDEAAYGGGILVFEPPAAGGPSPAHQAVVLSARNDLQNRVNGRFAFWTPNYVNVYTNILMIVHNHIAGAPGP